MAYGGVFPTVDMEGRPLTGARAAKAGSKIHGGPYALASIRWDMLNNKNVFLVSTPQKAMKLSTYINMYLTQTSLIRGDWKWHRESWNLRRHWTWKFGICFKCFATSGYGPNVWLVLGAIILFLQSPENIYSYVPKKCSSLYP